MVYFLIMIDLIFPFHRDDRHLREAVTSLTLVEGHKLRMIIVDDRIDQSLNLRELFTGFGTYEYINTIGGVGYGECLRLASEVLTSEIVALMNSDDLIRSDRFLKQASMLETAEIATSRMLRIDHRGKNVPSILGEISGPDYHPIFLLLGAYGANSTWCTRLEWWKTNVFFDGNQCLDWRVAFNSFNHSKISYTSEPLYFYRKHRNQVTAVKNIYQDNFSELYDEWRKFCKLITGREFSRDVFNLFAVPWNKNSSIADQEFLDFKKFIADKIVEINVRLTPDMESLLNRRGLLALRKTNNTLTSAKIISTSRNAILPLASDFIVSAAHQAFH